MAYVELKYITKFYDVGQTTLAANYNMTFNVQRGELVVILGASGSGKTTLLNMIGGMDKPDTGQIIVDGAHIETYNEAQLARYRKNDVGFVFQFYNLVNNLTAKENIELGCERIKGHKPAMQALAEVGLADKAQHFPSQLSGGEQQRVSIARALAKYPKLLLCDEPTGALDFKTGRQVFKLLQDLSAQGHTVIIITHNAAIADIANRVILIKEGHADKTLINKAPINALDLQ